MICYVCGEPAVGQCQTCWRFYCKNHGDVRCQNCMGAAAVRQFPPAADSFAVFEEEPAVQVGDKMRWPPHLPKPPGLRSLERVIPVVTSQTRGRTELTVVSIESYDDGFVVNYIVRGGPSPLRPKPDRAIFHVPHLWWEGSDDASVSYEALPRGSGGNAREFRGSTCFAPRLNPAASVLHLRVQEVQWLAHFPREKSSLETGPWQFDITLT
jgi:hypothetical protein